MDNQLFTTQANLSKNGFKKENEPKSLVYDKKHSKKNENARFCFLRM